MTLDQDIPASYLGDKAAFSPSRVRAIGIVAPLLVAALAFWMADTTHLDRIEGVTTDWRFRVRGPRPVPDNILIVEIDEVSRRSLKHDGLQFSLREHLVPALDNLWDAGSLVIGLDVYLQDLTTPKTDEALATAINEMNVVLAVTHTDGRTLRAPAPFLDMNPSEGVITVYPDSGNILRRFPPYLSLDVPTARIDNNALQSIAHFPLTLAMFAVWQEEDQAELRFVGGTAHMGSYTACPRELIDWCASRSLAPTTEPSGWKSLRFDDVVQGRFDPSIVDGMIVLIGEVRSIQDSHVIPLSDDLIPGVYCHANALAHILQRRGFNTNWSTGLRRALLTALLTLAAGLFAWHQQPWWKYRRSLLLLIVYLLAGIALFLGGWTVLVFHLFENNIVLPVTAPLLGMALAMGTGLMAQWVTLNENAKGLAKRARQIELLFGQSVSHSVLEAIKRQPVTIRETQTREVSVLFCDLRSFTAQTAEMSPADVAEMLNEYFNYITAAVFEHDGFIDKFVGDEIMAVFSVPFEQTDHPVRAVRTAIAIKKRLSDLNRVRAERGQLPLECGLGIHCGEAAAGFIGSRQRSNYTVVGTTVNLAARIEQHTKKGEILISDTVRKQLPPDIVSHFWGEVEIRGASGLHALYEVKTANST